MRRSFLSRNLKRRMHGGVSDGRAILLCGVIVLMFGILSRFLSHPPYVTLRLLGIAGVSPAPWLMSLLWTAWYALAGACLGAVLSCRLCCRQVNVYRGSMFLIISLVFSYVWYPLFFGCGLILLGLWDCLIILAFAILAALEYIRVYFFAGVLLLAYSAWLAYCTFLNACALFC